jgi:hypothetical protein
MTDMTLIRGAMSMQMALVPLGNYVFFLAQFQTFGYCIVYFAALAIRYRWGAATHAAL